MKSLVKTLVIEGCLLILLIAWLVILLISLNIVPVSGFEAIQNLFKPGGENNKLYGIAALFGGVGVAIIYSTIMVFFYYIRVSRKVMYFLNVSVYSITLASVVVGLLLIFLNF